jgi:hypothetical protein
MKKAVLFKSRERFAAFKEVIERAGIACIVLDFDELDWVDFDYGEVDFVIYYPGFLYSSNHPLALYEVYDNLIHIKKEFPEVQIYPDPKIIWYYNDKYRQYLFLKRHRFPIALTYPLVSKESLDTAEREIGFPMVIKNRFGAGGGSVFKIGSRTELESLYRVSTLDLFSFDCVRFFWNLISKRIFYYHLIRRRRMTYPFLSPPLLAQKYVKMDRDLKTVVVDYRVVEAHWRHQAKGGEWKMNIDGGGIGVWESVPDEAIELSSDLAEHLGAKWLNIDFILEDGKFLISEFSPVWHHYAYKEKASFVYRDSYNIDVPLDISLNLEKMIVDSIIGS